jgi:hypothetical protein
MENGAIANGTKIITTNAVNQRLNTKLVLPNNTQQTNNVQQSLGFPRKPTANF